MKRVVLVESGSREITESFLTWLNKNSPEFEHIDLVTCYPGAPRGFDETRGTIHRVHEYRGSARRKELYAKLEMSPPGNCVIVCSGEPIMTKWKWSLAWHANAKVVIVNENGDFFFLDRSNWRNVKGLMLYRAGLTGGNAVTTLAHLALFPFTLTYLLLFAAWVHLRRKARA